MLLRLDPDQPPTLAGTNTTTSNNNDLLLRKTAKEALEHDFLGVFCLLAVFHPESLRRLLDTETWIRSKADRLLPAHVNPNDSQLLNRLATAGFSLPAAAAGSESSWIDTRTWSPLHLACEAGRTAEVSALLLSAQGQHVDIDEKGLRDRTPLHQAAHNGHMEIVKILVLQHGADLDAETFMGSTAADLAAQRGYHRIAKFLEIEAAKRRRMK
jgi:Ankyrin repeats (3 copies)